MFEITFRYVAEIVGRHGQYGRAVADDKAAAVAIMEGLVAGGKVDIIVVFENGFEVQRWTESVGYFRKRRLF